MQRLTETRDLQVIAIDGEEVLTEVVGADRQEIRFRAASPSAAHAEAGTSIITPSGGCRGHVFAVAAQIVEQLPVQPANLAQFVEVRDHRQEYPQPPVLCCAQQRPKLGE